MLLNGSRWSDWVTQFVCPDFQHFGDVVKTRILPVFDGIAQEADDIATRRYDDMMANTPASDDGGDVSHIAEVAMTAGFEHYDMLTSMHSATLNLYTAALYHLTEQHLVDLMAMASNLPRTEEVSPRQAIDWFKTKGLDVKALPSWSGIDELRLIANVVKHAEGHSAEDLRKVRPDLFQPPFAKAEALPKWHGRVRKPLFGQDIYVTAGDFQEYHDASVSFWSEVAAQLS
jgi:hypothetical protein